MRAAIGVGFLAVAMVGCGDHFDDPVRPGTYTPWVWVTGCRGADPQVLPPVEIASGEEMAEHALRWEGSCGTDPSADVDGPNGAAQCGEQRRAIRVGSTTLGFTIDVDGCDAPLIVEYVEHARCAFVDGGARCGGDAGP